MKYLYSLLFSVIFVVACNGQTKHTDSIYVGTIIKQATMMQDAVLKNDMGTLLNYMHPKIIEMSGGKQNFLEAMHHALEDMESNKTKILRVSIGEPSKIIKYKKELQCTLPQTVEMSVSDGKVIAKTTLIAISKDRGKNWYFIDVAKNDLKAMKKVIPTLSNQLIIPEHEEPTFYEN